MKWNKLYRLRYWGIAGTKAWIRDEEGKILEFDTYLEAANYAGTKGLCETYPTKKEEVKK